MKLKRLLIFLLIIILLGILSYYYPLIQSTISGKSVSNNNDYTKEPANVIKIIDGDTIETDLGTIRLLGVNTPEHGQPYSNEATDFLKSLLYEKNVLLLRDSEDKDKYNRKLRYVFYNDNLANIELIQNGLATSFMIRGLKYEDKLRNAEKNAINNGIGLWKKSTEQCSSCIKLVQLNHTEEFFTIKNLCNFSCNMSGWLAKDDANHFFYFDGLLPFQAKKYNSNTAFDSNGKKVLTDVWNNDGDRFFLRDREGNLALFYEY